MKFAFIAAQEVAFPVVAMCRVLKVSPSGFYAWKKRPPPPRTSDDDRLAAAIADAHRRSRGVYGSHAFTVNSGPVAFALGRRESRD